MDFRKVTLKNGLRVLTVPISSFESATLTVWVKTGSRFEEKKTSGISHFLEHMVFKGSKKRPSAKEISEVVDSIGGEFNAGTSKEWTDFYIKTRSANLETAFDVLSDMVLNPLLKEEEIEKEKGVIIEEIKMYEDTPMYRIGDVFEQLIFRGNSLGRDISGTQETVKAIKRRDFENYRRDNYFSENILVTVSGGINEDKVLKLTEKYFGELQSKQKSKFKLARRSLGEGGSKLTTFKNTQKKPQVLLHSKKKEQAHFILGFLGTKRGSKDRYAEAILATILGGGMSSRLFIEVRERRGLAYAIRTSPDHYNDTGYISTYAGVDVNKISEAIKIILEEHYKIRNSKFEIRNSELKKAKEFLKGHLALSLEDTKDVNSFFGLEELLLGKVRTPEDVYKEIDKVETRDLVRIAKELFVPERLNLAVIGPYKNREKFEKLLF